MREFADPVLLEAMPLADKLLYSTITLILGMGITFLVLILLMAAIKVMSAALTGKKEQKAEPVPQPVVKAPVAAPSVIEVKDESDDQELIAVITAAIMSFQGEHGEDKRFRINSVRKAGERVPSWAAAGIHDAMRN